jgi:hypothetical protein
MNDTQWYIMQDGEPAGPISHAKLLSRAKSGRLECTDLVWQDGFSDWVQAGTIKGLFLAPPPPPKLKAGGVASSPGEPMVSQSSRVVRAANRKMISQLRDDAADIQLLIAEITRVLVRLNPVNLQIYNYLIVQPQLRECNQQAVMQAKKPNCIGCRERA